MGSSPICLHSFCMSSSWLRDGSLRTGVTWRVVFYSGEVYFGSKATIIRFVVMRKSHTVKW